MIIHDAAFETLAKAPVKRTDVVVAKQILGETGYIDSTPLWNSSGALIDVKIDAIGEMLGTATKKAVVNLMGLVSTVTPKDLFQIRLGLWGGSSFNYISQGFFVVDTVDYNYDAGSTTVTMYDHMWTASRSLYTETALGSAIAYPASVGDVASHMASLLGVSLMTGFKNLPNAEFEIQADLYRDISGATLQNVIQDIAGATGTTARITDTTLVFSQYDVNSENLDSSTLKTLKIGDTYGPITSVVLGRVPQNDNIVINALAPTTNAVTAVNTTTNMLTIVANGMPDGNMVQLSSTGTLPAPLLANTPYYVYKSTADNFNLAPTYEDAVNNNYALNFDGADDAVLVPHSTSINVGNNDSYFVSVWFKTSTIADQSISEKWYDDGAPVIDKYPWAIRGPVGAGAVSFNIYDGSANPGIGSGGNLADGKWHHVVGYRDYAGDKIGLYIDGVSKGSTADTTNGNVSTDRQVTIGGRSMTSQEFLGQLDEFRLYSGVPSQDTVTKLFNRNYNIRHTMLAGYDFNAGTGSVLPDISGNGNNGTIVGATWVDNRKLIDLTTAGTGTITVDTLATKEIQINNNQILDNDRQELLPDLYNSLSGIKWTDVKADTIGLGWHEIGDVIQFTQGSTTVRAFLNEIHLSLEGSIKENLISKIPEIAAINYQTAGGIAKSLYNAEIKVDKQANEITSIVSVQNVINEEVQEDFTQIRQDVDSIDFTIQSSGGGNLLLNSVGFAKEQTLDLNDVSYGKLVGWDYEDIYTVADSGVINSFASSESQNYGGLSGQAIQMQTDYLIDNYVMITQEVDVAVNTPMSFGMRINKAANKGWVIVIIENENDLFYWYIPTAQGLLWDEFIREGFTSSMSKVLVTIMASAENCLISDMRLLYGDKIRNWVQSDKEIMSTNVQFTEDGMRIFDENRDLETQVTYNEFSTRRRSDGAILFEADDTGVVTNDLKIKGSTSYMSLDGDGDDEVVIKQITIPTTNSRAGIAFIRVT